MPSSAITVRRLLPDPDPGPIDVAALLAELGLPDRAPAGRPYVIANLIESADGRATFDGRSSALGDDGDRQLFRGLRSVCDAVLAGTGTLAAEHYGRLVRDRELLALRERHGLERQPLLCTVTRSGRVPPGIPLLSDDDARVVIYSAAPVQLAEVRADVEIVELQGDRPPLEAALSDLRERRQTRLLLCEGGPTLLGEAIARGVVDELFLTIAAKLAGGDGTPILTGLDGLTEPYQLKLLWLLERHGSLFARYGLR